jgi:hypothetical protein
MGEELAVVGASTCWGAKGTVSMYNLDADLNVCAPWSDEMDDGVSLVTKNDTSCYQ